MMKSAAIIVTYNPEIKTLKSLVELLGKQVNQIIIIDNNSNNYNELVFLESKCHVIYNDTNLGLATAQNMGIKLAIEEADYLILFDQDSSIPDNYVELQIKCYESLIRKGEMIAAVGPKFTDESSGYVYPATIYQGPFIKRVPVVDEPVEATFIIASGCLIPKKVIENVGYMKDIFFIDFVDIEWCMRAKSMGYKSFINPFALMQHNIGDARISIFGRLISLHSDFRKYYIYRNGIFMIKLKYVPFGYKLRLFIFNIIRTILGIITSKDKIATSKVSFKGWIAGFSAKEV
ncbi:glycosyltransferase family 2 protein [Klebsiella pneumoniae]|uniref:glycosyltransferase family 2 protein n=1 Tax=Klebsiella TaxID=570 RepID=UPI0007CCBB81|nr:glycosyltransferase family 2 protein [Klebsiella pneumoniae]MBA8739993.1 glycosyltransferase family 2 protein [Klebsiella pneumoniae]MBC4161718.1 glycosyltransferase family 2 protein [Klebsiella pneumoniae]MBC4172143.1 glycosyltransferase family 2 protein [Klebsiella pneumoniae]MBC4262046.1 glycosyltransferase family 2 protein [Klebsiella pneumoniae]MBL4341965.1 glycosyltransferase family 2 protein [Klebsiella pneumoniae]